MSFFQPVNGFNDFPNNVICILIAKNIYELVLHYKKIVNFT